MAPGLSRSEAVCYVHSGKTNPVSNVVSRRFPCNELQGLMKALKAVTSVDTAVTSRNLRETTVVTRADESPESCYKR